MARQATGTPAGADLRGRLLGARGGDERAAGHAQAAVGLDEPLEVGADPRPQGVNGVRVEVLDQLSNVPRDPERRLPVVVDAARLLEGDVDRLDLDLREAGVLQQRAQLLLAPHVERTRWRGRRMPLLRERGEARPGPRIVLDGGPRPERETPAGPQHAPRLAERGVAVDGEHVAEAAEDGIDAGGRQVDPLQLHRLELDVLDAQLLRALLRLLEHRLGAVGADQRPARLDQLRREEAELARAGRQLEDPLARLRLDRVDHRLRDRHRDVADALLEGAPPLRHVLPALAGVGASRVRVVLGAHAGDPTYPSSRRSSLPEG